MNPPFDSKADYSHKMTIPSSVIPAEAGIQDFEFTKEPSVIERLAYKDTWAGGTDSYLDSIGISILNIFVTLGYVKLVFNFKCREDSRRRVLLRD